MKIVVLKSEHQSVQSKNQESYEIIANYKKIMCNRCFISNEWCDK